MSIGPARSAVVLAIGAAALVASACGTAATRTPNGARSSTVPSTAAQPVPPGSTTTTTTSSNPTPAGLSVMTEPAAGYGFITSAISAAHEEVELTMYELSDTGVEQALSQAVARGVSVQVLLDQHLERSNNEAAYVYLSDRGVQVHWGPSGTTVHQKTLCVDDDLCYVMTGNLTPRYYADDRDFVVVDRQRGDVSAIVATFGADFSGAEPGPGPGGTDLVWSPGSEPALVGLIASATSSLEVETEEMDSAAIVSALEQAAQRGVRVQVVMTDDPEWHTAFDELSQAGVAVFTYTEDAPLYVHAKAIVADSARAFVGSENFSASSMDDNRELGLITSDAAVVGPLASRLDADAAGGVRWQP